MALFGFQRYYKQWIRLVPPNISVRLRSIRKSSGLHFEAFEDSVDKTTIELTSRTPDMHPLLLSGYGPRKFQFVNTIIAGPVAIIDNAVFRWKIEDAKDITASSLAMFYMIYPKLDIVVVGTGNKYHPISNKVIADMKSQGVAIEVQDTRHACGTYNLLKKERPELVGAALLPITEHVPVTKMIHRGGRPAIDR
ncbi:unnamed protein product [Clavelina lepadiformis]|uniref:NADH dehydrogenase [ubiquinone] 1 alpha subcomplex assembly factor 3 n=1 Tax=Clavelina lepadiformis TaxID=159417 RepID=A0ABP0GEH6_CLALP